LPNASPHAAKGIERELKAVNDTGKKEETFFPHLGSQFGKVF